MFQLIREIPGRILKWSPLIQALGAVGVAFIGVTAYFIEIQIAQQERERTASERALALSDYFVNSQAVLTLKDTAADIYKAYSDVREKPKEHPHRDHMLMAVTNTLFGEKKDSNEVKSDAEADNSDGKAGKESSLANRPYLFRRYHGDPNIVGSDQVLESAVTNNIDRNELKRERLNKENMYRYFSRLFSELKRISNCGGYENFQFDDGRMHEIKERSYTIPLCDRITLRTLIMDEMSELFFAYRYVFYCDAFLHERYKREVRLFENMVGLYLLYDHSKLPNYSDVSWMVFLEDRDRERATEAGILSRDSQKFYILRLPHEAEYCDDYRKRLKPL